MRGFKAYNNGLICRDFQYKEGETYEQKGEIEICRKGFHFCENPLDVLDYYDLTECEFTEVEALGKVQKNDGRDSKHVTDKIKIGARLDLKGFIKASFDFLWEKCNEKSDENSAQLASSGHYAQLASSGDYAKLASSGHYAQLASSGDSAQLASSGHYVKLASSGDSAQLASSGHYAQLASSGDSAQLASSGHYAKLASSGHYAQLASSGDSAQLASSGHYAQLASSGDSAQLAINGETSVGACVGIGSIIKGQVGCWITLAEWTHNGERYIPVCVKSAQIDGETLKPDTWYRLENGEFKEV